jgi:GNAT superfamily N-acetyltransferase
MPSPLPAASSPSLQDLAEDAFAWMEGPLAEFDRRPEFVLRNLPNPNPVFGMVLRPRLRDADDALETVRAWFAQRGRERYSWWVSDAAEPRDLVDQLLARGLRPADDPVSAGMVLEREPEGVPGIEVRKVATFDEALAAMKVGWESFHFTAEEIESATATARKRYDAWKDLDSGDTFIAVVDGEVVGAGGAFYLRSGVYLAAGNVAEHARGRGVYRALVRARWDEAVRRGTPALVVQAGKMSRPILERLGFERRCDAHLLIDSTA